MIDLAGAQNDQFEAVRPFDVYARREGRDLYKLRAHGYHAFRFGGVVGGRHRLKSAEDPRVLCVLSEGERCLRNAVCEWEAGRGGRIESKEGSFCCRNWMRGLAVEGAARVL